MLRLFCIRDKSGIIVRDLHRKPMFFGKKEYAKTFRSSVKGAYISPGPDHKRW